MCFLIYDCLAKTCAASSAKSGATELIRLGIFRMKQCSILRLEWQQC